MNPPNPEEILNAKLASNDAMQKDEVRDLTRRFRDNFEIGKNGDKYSIRFCIRGLEDSTLTFSFPPLYPSDVPPTYFFEATWLNADKRKQLGIILKNKYTGKFGESIIYSWAEEIIAFLKQLRQNVTEKENISKEKHTKVTDPCDKCPEIFEGKAITDRNSSFSPYLAEVASEEDVKLVIERIEERRKVATAFRNTYAYRYQSSSSKQTEVGEDGGEPKAGRNLLQKLKTYNANNVIVYISRRIGVSYLGPDRYKHLNNAADNVLRARGYGPSMDDSKMKRDKKVKKSKYK